MTPDTPALVARLEAIAHRFDMTATERYEQDSEAFYAATGYMAPGKDVPMAMGGQDEAERRAAHEVWIAERNRQQRDGLRAAAAALTALARDLETARLCPDCHQPLVCPAGTGERIAGLEAMHEETLTRAERAEADLATARQERAEAQSNYDGACRTIALMHEAATGRSGEGPHLGVVEDVAAAVRAARAETWEEAAEWVKGCREDDQARPMVQVFDVMAKKLLERATAAREGQ